MFIDFVAKSKTAVRRVPAAPTPGAPTMTACCFDPATDTFSVQTVPIPEPGPLDVRVRVSACALNPVDAKIVNWKGAQLLRMVARHTSHVTRHTSRRHG